MNHSYQYSIKLMVRMMDSSQSRIRRLKGKKKQNNKAVGQKQYVDPGMRKFFEEMGGSSSGDSGNTPILNFRTKNKLFGKDEERRQPSTASVS